MTVTRTTARRRSQAPPAAGEVLSKLQRANICGCGGASDPGRPADEVRAAGPDQASHGSTAPRARARRSDHPITSTCLQCPGPWLVAGCPASSGPCALWLLSERSAEVERRPRDAMQPRAAAPAPVRSRHESLGAGAWSTHGGRWPPATARARGGR